VLRGNTASITSAATADATSNGYTTGVNGATVTVNNPPLSGSHINDPNYVEAIVARSEPTFFMQALGISSLSISARAVAGLESSGTCIYVLDSSSNNAFVVSGGGTVNVPCAVVVDSTATNGLVASGGSCINATIISVAASGYSPGCYTPTPITGSDSEADPLAYLTAPTAAGSCDAAHTNYSINAGTATLSAGTYCGGINVQGGATVTLNAGTYIMKGGGFAAQGNGTHLNGTGVTIYNTCDSGSCATSTSGYNNFQIKSSATANMSAPTSGSLANILVFIDRDAPDNKDVTFSAATLTFTGTIYAKTEQINFSGGFTAAGLSLNLVSRLLNLNGNSNLNLDHTFPTGSAIKQVDMVE
jgi:hypothetical protein